MEIEIRIPTVGESVGEGLLARWHAKDGGRVRKDEALLTVETDKITFEVAAEADGTLTILVGEGETVKVDTLVGKITTQGEEKAASRRTPETVPASSGTPETAATAGAKELPAETREPEPKESRPEKSAEPKAGETGAGPPEDQLLPSVRRLAEERGVDLSRIQGTGPGGRITKGDVLLFLESSAPEPAPLRPAEPDEPTTRKPMTPIRRRIAERLLDARRNTAMLTTFNEVDLGRVQAFRSQFKEAFRAKYGVALGLMSFFVKASVEALREIPEVNAFIEGDDLLYHDYYHIGVAVGAERGLVVPVLRHSDRMSFAEIEQAIRDYVAKIEKNRLELSDLEGGTFTITNGGVYGSLLSTPILNPPQSGILGLHKIEERPVVVGGQIVVRPMMYVALSYDHRIVDGRQAVTFLRRIKECVEDPERLLVDI